jgi:beta-glucanase (GH16 family)
MSTDAGARIGRSGLPILTALLLASLASLRAQAPPAVPEGWTLTWSDEFDAPDGTPPDPSKWVHDLGGGGWGNEELQTYTSRPENAVIRHGQLVITARRERVTGADGITRDYTSARLKTLGRFAQRYGRFEARIQVPRGQGIWPAFWMLGADFPTAGWPACGEIDIMEHIGREPARVYGTIHGPGYAGAEGMSGSTTLAAAVARASSDSPAAGDGPPVADDFHVFAVEWEPGAIRWYVNDQHYFTRTPADLPAGARWAFDREFFMLLNLAVGGRWPGYPDATTIFPQELKVDYVRVYRRSM